MEIFKHLQILQSQSGWLPQEPRSQLLAVKRTPAQAGLLPGTATSQSLHLALRPWPLLCSSSLCRTLALPQPILPTRAGVSDAGMAACSSL